MSRSPAPVAPARHARPRTFPLLTAAVAAAALSACGVVGGGGSGYAPADPYSGAPAGAGTGADTLVPPRATILSANSTARLGTVVIDGLGRTLYRFDSDAANPPTATCVDDCASAWPPVLEQPDAPLVLEGVDEDAVGTVTRSDGSVQMTIGGWPVYRYTGDPAPGSTSGHGVAGSWFAVTPEGTRATAP